MSTSVWSRTKGTLLVLGIASAILVFVVIALYVIRLAAPSGFQLSGSPEHWAQFGDYLAGTLGPIFSLLAFIGVLCTVWLQATQLDLMKGQATLDEIQRSLSSVSSRLEELLAENVNHLFQAGLFRDAPSFFRVLSAGGSAALRPQHENERTRRAADVLITEAKLALKPSAAIVGIELDHLAWLLERYVEAGGAKQVVAFYRRRYDAITCWLDILGFLNAHERVHVVFRPADHRASLRDAPPPPR